MNGLTVSLVGRHSHDYYQDSVTIWLSSLRRSHVPYNRNVTDWLRCFFHALTSSHWKMSWTAALWRSSRLIFSYFSGWHRIDSSLLFRQRVINAPSCLVSHYLANYSRVGFPSERNEHSWTLKFKQYSFHHISQVLRSPQGYSLFHQYTAFPTGYVSPAPFGFRWVGWPAGFLIWQLTLHALRALFHIAITWRTRLHFFVSIIVEYLNSQILQRL